MKRLLLLLWLTINIALCQAQEISSIRKDSLIAGIKTQVLENFVSTDKAAVIVDSLHSSAFSTITARGEFIKAVNAKLYLYTRDKHLNVEYQPIYAKELRAEKDEKSEQDLKEKKENYGFETPKILPGNTGYLKLKYFADTENASKAAWESIRLIRHTSALILDLRGNSGGSGSMVQLLCSIFLPNAQDPILSITYKKGNTVTLKTDTIEHAKKYLSKPLFILVDEKTFSAAEAFTFILKNRQRATIIGNTTAGAGNISGPYPLDKEYIITIPVGKITDPLTKTGWEGIGVQPNIETTNKDPLEKAKELASSARLPL